MRTARIKGYVTSTIKHSSLGGWRLLIAQPVNQDETPDGPPQIVIDALGTAIHQKVMISSDGAEARRLVGDARSPARWNVLGIIDPERSLAL
jgi:ethanolamine utilization protein EutN